MPKKQESDEDEIKESEDKEEQEAEENVYEDFDSFTPMSVSGAETPGIVLESGETLPSAEDLETGIADVDVVGGSAGGEGATEEEEPRIYNMPDYGTDYELLQQRERDERRDREMIVSPLNLRQESSNDARKIDFGQWQRGVEEQAIQRRHSDEDYEIYKLKRAEQSEGLPFEEKKRKKRLF